MLCEKCGQRSANVFQTDIFTHKVGRDSWQTRTERLLCEVCAGMKTEEQLQAEVAERQVLSQVLKERRKEAIRALLADIKSSLFGSRREELQATKSGSYCTAIEPELHFCLMTVGSRLPEADPMEALFGTEEKGKNHVVRQISSCEVHVIRWDADPNRLMEHIFEPFPWAGARLDLSERLLFVERCRDLFPGSFRSLGYCNLAASLITIPPAGSRERRMCQFKPHL